MILIILPLLFMIYASIFFIIVSWRAYQVIKIKPFIFLQLSSTFFLISSVLGLHALLIDNRMLIKLTQCLSYIFLLVAISLIILFLEYARVEKPQKLTLTLIALSLSLCLLGMRIADVKYVRVNNLNAKMLAFHPIVVLPLIILLILIIREIGPLIPSIVKQQPSKHVISLLSFTALSVLSGILASYQVYFLSATLAVYAYYFQYLISGTSITFLSIIFRRKISVAVIAPLEVYGAIICSPLGYTIAYRAFGSKYKKTIQVATSMLAAVISLTRGVSEKKYEDIFQVYKLTKLRLIIYYGKYSVGCLLTKLDNSILRNLTKELVRQFEARTVEFPENMVPLEAKEEGERILDELSKIVIA